MEAHSARNVLCGVRCCLFGILLYFMRFTMGGTKGVYTLRSLPTGAEGLAGSMLLAVLWAFLLLWAVQIVAVYVSYGVYHWETALYNLPGARVGTASWVFRCCCRIPLGPLRQMICISLLCARRFCKCFIRAICFCAAVGFFPPAACCLLCLSRPFILWAALVGGHTGCRRLGEPLRRNLNGGKQLGQWDISACIFLAFEVAYMAACTVWMLGMAYRLCRKSLLD